MGLCPYLHKEVPGMRYSGRKHDVARDVVYSGNYTRANRK